MVVGRACGIPWPTASRKLMPALASSDLRHAGVGSEKIIM
jgi:hypothetical protein